MKTQTLVLRHRWALGDTVLLTALVRDIALTYPGRFRIAVDSHWTPVWYHNPRLFVPPNTYQGGDAQRVEISWKLSLIHI